MLLPYIPIILDNGKNKSSKYDTRLIDNLKLYLKLIFDHASTYKFFNYNFIKYYGHSIMQQSTVIAQTQERIQVKQHRIFSLTYGQIMNQKNRDKIYNKDGILMQKDSKNKDVDVSVKSEGFIALLKEEAKCLGTGFTAADIIVNGEKQNYICNTYIMQCLYGTGIEKCKIFLQHPEFWENAVKEVKNMFPVIMVSTLKAFGLITVRRKDPVTKSELIFSESINDWFTRLQGFVNNPDLNIITASELKAIYENKQLVAYINEIILRVNFNPSILNINYVPKKSNKNILKRIKQAKGMLPQYNPFNTGILRRMRYITFSSSFDEQVGGDPNRNYSIKDTYLDTLNPANTRKLSKVFSVILINLIQQLKSNNKSIDDEDKSKFIGLIKETEEIEKNLSKVMNIFKNYIRYMALNPDNTPETISYDDMENTDIVPVKQRHKVAIIKYPMLSAGILQKRIYADGRTLNKKRNVVIEALQLLEDAVENSSKKGYKEQVVIKPLLGSVVSLSVEPHVDADMWPAR